MEEVGRTAGEAVTENVRKAGGDPAAIMKELKHSLAQYKAAY